MLLFFFFSFLFFIGRKSSCTDKSYFFPKINEDSAKKFLAETEEKMVDFMADETREVIVIPGSTLTGFFRKILYNNIASKYQNILIRNITTEGERNVEIRKFETQDDRKTFLEKEKERLLNDQVS